MLTVHNPKGFSFVLPTASESAGIVEFKELSPQPTLGTHYDLERTSSSRLELIYKKAFLQKYEQGSGSLNPTITLKATDGRVFKKTYTFGIKSNTPPPKPAVVLAKQTNASPNYYVLCIDTNDLGALSAFVNGKYIHDDIAYVTVNGTSYGLEMNDTHNGFSKKPAEPSFLANGTGLMAVDSTQLPTASPWVLYYKTDIQIGPSNPLTTYRITLRDKEGVTSDEADATIEPSGQTHTVTFSVEDGRGGTLKAKPEGGTGSTTPATDTVSVEHGTTVTFTATPYPGWELDSWTGVTSSSSLNATLTVDGDTTVTVKFKKVTAVAEGNDNAWTLLKNAVKVADHNAIITIDGEITASIGNSGQIEIDETLTIEGKTGPDKDILDANTMSRIFKVASGKTLTLKNLTLKGGKATGTGDADSGGAIFASNATVNIENCIITDNKADTNGGGIYVENTYTTITNCIFTKNTAINGGGIYTNKTGSSTYVVEISGGTIGGGTEQANKATGNGGGIYVGQSCPLRLKDSTASGTQGVLITGNQAPNGGGVYAANNADVSMQGGTQIAVDNDVYLYSGSAIVVNKVLNSTGTVARITPENYSEFPPVKVLYGDAVGSEHGKFAVTRQKYPPQEWVVDSNGNLKKKN